MTSVAWEWTGNWVGLACAPASGIAANLCDLRNFTTYATYAILALKLSEIWKPDHFYKPYINADPAKMVKTSS